MVDRATDLKGSTTPPAAVHLERGPAVAFATALTDDNPVHHDPAAAREAGFDDLPVAPTYPFAWNHWGAFPELQPEGASDESPVRQAVAALRAGAGGGGLILHGEQAFTYHRWPVVGETLHSRGRIADVYEKQGRSTMTFVVLETEWLDAQDEPVVTSTMTLLHKA